VEAPVGMTFLGYENPPGVTTERREVATLFVSLEKDRVKPGIVLTLRECFHALVENPKASIADIRETFRMLRC
jgi:hypothetical protein